MRRIRMILAVTAAMAMMLVVLVAPALADTNDLVDNDRDYFVSSSDSDWNDYNDLSPFYNDDYYGDYEGLKDVEDAYEDYVDAVEDYVEDYEGSYWGFNSYW